MFIINFIRARTCLTRFVRQVLTINSSHIVTCPQVYTLLCEGVAIVIKGYVALLGRRHIEVNLINGEYRNLLPVVWP